MQKLFRPMLIANIQTNLKTPLLVKTMSPFEGPSSLSKHAVPLKVILLVKTYRPIEGPSSLSKHADPLKDHPLCQNIQTHWRTILFVKTYRPFKGRASSSYQDYPHSQVLPEYVGRNRRNCLWVCQQNAHEIVHRTRNFWPFLAKWRLFGRILDLFWPYLRVSGPVRVLLGTIWAIFKHFCTILAKWRPFRRILGLFWAYLRYRMAYWAHSGVYLGHFEAFLAYFWPNGGFVFVVTFVWHVLLM